MSLIIFPFWFQVRMDIQLVVTEARREEILFLLFPYKSAEPICVHEGVKA